MLLLSIGYAGLMGCTPEPEPRDRLLDEIESAIQLPKGAFELDEYGRAYAVENGDVYGHFLMPMPFEIGPDDGCEEMLANGDSIPCDSGWEGDLEAAYADQIPAGERQWFNDASELPYISDGGCMMVSFKYSPKTKQFDRLECNGTA